MVGPIPDRLERTLRQTLASGERVFVQLRGAFTEALVCTDTRVIILKGGWMTGQLFGTDTFQCPYRNIETVEVWGSSPHGPTIIFNTSEPFLRNPTETSPVILHLSLGVRASGESEEVGYWMPRGKLYFLHLH